MNDEVKQIVERIEALPDSSRLWRNKGDYSKYETFDASDLKLLTAALREAEEKVERRVEFEERITRQMLRDNPDKIYLFGDNYERAGLGGQAREMRGEPNAYGIATKRSPDNSERAFFSDTDYTFHAGRMFAEFQGLKQLIRDRKPTAIVIPKAGLGTGFAMLHIKAPRVFALLEGFVSGFTACYESQDNNP